MTFNFLVFAAVLDPSTKIDSLPTGPPEMKVTGEFRLKGTLAIGFASDIPPIPPALFIGVRKNVLDLLWGFLGQQFLRAFAKEIQIGLVHAAVAVDIAVVLVVAVASIIGVFGFDLGQFLPPATDPVAGFRADH